MTVYSNKDVAEQFPKVKVLQPMKRYKIGNFQVTALPVEHNVECYGYIIDHSEMGRLIFYTDTKSFNYRISDVNYILGEVNFSEDIVIDNICNGEEVRSQFNNHMSLDTAIDVVRRLYNPRLSSVLCCHLSDSNSSEKKIYERFKNELGIEVDFCDSGKVFTLQSEDF